jgi:hypothetical protein
MLTEFIIMRQQVDELEQIFSNFKADLANAKADLAKAIRNCKHEWSTPAANHIRTDGYTIPGDPPDTMGVDRRQDFYVEPKITKRWTRVCALCGEIQHTGNTQKQVTEIPAFD